MKKKKEKWRGMSREDEENVGWGEAGGGRRRMENGGSRR